MSATRPSACHESISVFLNLQLSRPRRNKEIGFICKINSSMATNVYQDLSVFIYKFDGVCLCKYVCIYFHVFMCLCLCAYIVCVSKADISFEWESTALESNLLGNIYVVGLLPEVGVYVSFVECLEILWKTWEKAPESAKTNIPTNFRNFENFLKSSEIFRSLRTSSEILGKIR